MTDYLRNTETNKLIKTGNLGRSFKPPLWVPATQEEVAEYLLEEAKSQKIAESKTSRDAFLSAGYQYSGKIICPAWLDDYSYPVDFLVYGSDGENYRSLDADNLNNEPAKSPVFWELYEPTFSMDSNAMVNFTVKCKLTPTAPDRYKFFTNSLPDGYRPQIDFGDAATWTAFIEAITAENDRIWRKYNVYRSLIAKCATVADVDAIVIDYSI